MAYAIKIILFTVLFAISYGLLRDSSNLVSHCYHFPDKDFGKTNNIRSTYGQSPTVILTANETAIDFTLATPEGVNVNLASLLENKPVVMIWGHYTCPAFQGYRSNEKFTGSSYGEEYTLVEEWKDKLYFLHMVGPEPHPIWPYANFDSGAIRMNLWSVIGQPQTYKERMEVSVAMITKYIHPEAIILVDTLDGKSGSANNPVWCSYANGARSAIFIDQNGTVQYTQDWFERISLNETIYNYFQSFSEISINGN